MQRPQRTTVLATALYHTVPQSRQRIARSPKPVRWLCLRSS
jgi:hypothetical protein